MGNATAKPTTGTTTAIIHAHHKPSRTPYQAKPPAAIAVRSISVGDRRMGHIENIYRCRTAADWFVLRSKRTSNSHIFGESQHVISRSRIWQRRWSYAG